MKALSHSAGKFLRGTILCVTSFECRKNLCLRGLWHDYLSIFFGSQYQKISLWNASVCHYFPVAKIFMLKRVRSRFFTDFFVPQNSGTSLGNCSVVCFRKSAVGKSLWMSGGGGGLSRFSVETTLSHSNEKLRRETLYCVTRLVFRETFRLKAFWHNFLSKVFVSECKKILT